ncbi:C40 family peptidase [Gordonia sputi]
MITVDILIAPLRILITALGTGVLPVENPATTIRSASTDLDEVRRTSAAATSAVQNGWHGTGSRGAVAAAERTARASTAVDDDGRQIATLVETASARIELAARQLRELVDSFERAATAMGPALSTPAGLVAIVPVAVDHVQRGLSIVSRTQADLADDTRAMSELGRHEAPAQVGSRPAANTTSPTSKGVAVTLPDGSVAYAPNERAATAVRAALSQQGVPYVWGGTTPDGFDCSGFTQWAYRQAGVELPRLAQEQDTAGMAVTQDQLLPGDLAVWDGHVAMYIGNDQLVEAGDPVGVSPLRTTNAGQGFQGFFRPK